MNRGDDNYLKKKQKKKQEKLGATGMTILHISTKPLSYVPGEKE